MFGLSSNILIIIFQLASIILSVQMLRMVVLLGIIQQLLAIDCQITAVVSYYYCVGLCRGKYGIKGNGTRKFFNRTSKLCQPQVVCDQQKGQYFVDYENRCANLFDDGYSTDVRGILSTFDTLIFSKAIVVHGSMASGPADGTLCYPGYKSSLKKGRTADNLGEYQVTYYCDLLLNDQTVPLSFGQYYFNILESSEKRDALDQAYGVEYTIFLYLFVWFFGWTILMVITLKEILK